MSRDHNVSAAVTLTIKEVSRRSGLSEHTLRYYEKIGLIQPVPRDNSGHRRYSAEMAETIELLACLRTSGLSIAEMRAHLKLAKENPRAATEQRALFVMRTKEIAEQIQRLQTRKRYLEGKVTYWDAVARGDVHEAERIMNTNKNILDQ